MTKNIVYYLHSELVFPLFYYVTLPTSRLYRLKGELFLTSERQHDVNSMCICFNGR